MPTNFSLLMNGQSIPAGITSAATQLTGPSGYVPESILIYNPDPTNAVFVKLGNASSSATVAQSMPILPGEKSVWSTMGCTHLATIRSAGTTAITVFLGEGG